MAYVIIAAIILLVVGWGVLMSKRSARADRAFRKPKPNFRGPVRSFRTRPQTDEQKSEEIMNNREVYDHTIDRLDPRHKDYRPRAGDASGDQ